MTGPQVAGEPASERLMRQVRQRADLCPVDVAAVLHALADYTAIKDALAYARDLDHGDATGLGRWFHAVGDDLER